MSYTQEIAQYIDPSLSRKKLHMNSVIKSRSQTRFYAVNGKNNYGPTNNVVEFVLSHADLLDMRSLMFSAEVKFTGPAGATLSFDEGFYSCIQEIAVYYSDILVERIEHYALVKNAMVYGSVNPAYYRHEMSAMAGVGRYTAEGAVSTDAVAPAGRYAINLDALGITKVAQLMPAFANNIRIVMRLAPAGKCMVVHTAEAVGPVSGSVSYTLDNVAMLIDTVAVDENYMRLLRTQMASESGLALPIQTIDVKTRKTGTAEDVLENFNLSYAELDSMFLLFKDTTKDQRPTSQAPGSGVDMLQVDIGGKYFTPTDGLHGPAELFGAMKKAFGSLHDAHGSTIFNRAMWSGQFTLLGVDCSKSGADVNVISNGTNTRALGYSCDVKAHLGTAPDANTTLYLMALHRKILTLANNAVDVSA